MKSIVIFLENQNIKPVNQNASFANFKRARPLGNEKNSHASNDVRSVNVRQASSAKHMAKEKPTFLGGARVFTTP